MFSHTGEFVKDQKDLLPWAVGNELLGGAKGWERLGDEGTRVIQEGVKKEVVEPEIVVEEPKAVNEDGEGKASEGPWRRQWARRAPFDQMPDSCDSLVFRLGIA